MKIKLFAIALIFAFSVPAMAACTSTFQLGALGTPSLSAIGNGFSSTQHFSDCYNFTLDGSGRAVGVVLDFDNSLRRDIALGEITLSGGSLSSPVIDPTATIFSFNNLLAGTYQLAIAGDVIGRDGGLFGGGMVGYDGFLAIVRSSVTPVPEPQTYAMILAGLCLLGLTAQRRKQKASA